MYSLDHSRAAQSSKKGRVLKVEKAERRSSALLPAWKPTPRTRTSHASVMVSSGTSTGKPHTSRASLGKPHGISEVAQIWFGIVLPYQARNARYAVGRLARR